MEWHAVVVVVIVVECVRNHSSEVEAACEQFELVDDDFVVVVVVDIGTAARSSLKELLLEPAQVRQVENCFG